MSQITIPISVQRMVCTGCGAEANASCNCGVSYEPKAVQARKAVETNPKKSNRAISAETGIPLETVRRARKSIDPGGSVEKRTGLDGRERSLPKKKDEPEARDPNVIYGPADTTSPEASADARKAQYAEAEPEAVDTSDIPEVGEEFFREATLTIAGEPAPKAQSNGLRQQVKQAEELGAQVRDAIKDQPTAGAKIKGDVNRVIKIWSEIAATLGLSQ